VSELEASIRDLISTYLEGGISVSELNDRLPDGWELDEANDPDATDLTLHAIGYLAGFQAGDRDEDDLRAMLDALVFQTVRAKYPREQLWSVLFSSAAITAERSVEARTPPAEGFEPRASQNRQTGRRTTTVPRDLVQSR